MHDVGHYLLSDRPLTEEQWIAERTKVIEGNAIEGKANVTPDVTQDEDDTAKRLD